MNTSAPSGLRGLPLKGSFCAVSKRTPVELGFSCPQYLYLSTNLPFIGFLPFPVSLPYSPFSVSWDLVPYRLLVLRFLSESVSEGVNMKTVTPFRCLIKSSVSYDLPLFTTWLNFHWPKWFKLIPSVYIYRHKNCDNCSDTETVVVKLFILFSTQLCVS